MAAPRERNPCAPRRQGDRVGRGVTRAHVTVARSRLQPWLRRRAVRWSLTFCYHRPMGRPAPRSIVHHEDRTHRDDLGKRRRGRPHEEDRHNSAWHLTSELSPQPRDERECAGLTPVQPDREQHPRADVHADHGQFRGLGQPVRREKAGHRSGQQTIGLRRIHEGHRQPAGLLVVADSTQVTRV